MVQTSAKRKIKKQITKKAGKLAIVMSLFNEAVCRNLLRESLKAFKENGYAEKDIRVFEVAGAFEIPFMIKQIAQTGRYAGIEALGCVIRGETPHFEYISQAVTAGCQQVQLETGCPVSFGVITVNNEEQAYARSREDEFNKGREAALALLDTLETIKKI